MITSIYKPLIAIIILSYNNPEVTTECLRSLIQQVYNNVIFILVDNASSDNAVEKLRQEFCQRVIFIENHENYGFAKGNNIGILKAIELKADYVMLLNNDTIVSPDFLLPLVDTLNSNSTIGAVTPKIYFTEGDRNILWAAGGQVNWLTGKLGNRGRSKIDEGQYDKIEDVDYLSGCCILAKREIFETLGFLNEAYFAYFEDADWCLRIQKSGYRTVYVPTSKIWHAVGTSSKQKKNKEGVTSPFIYYLTTRNYLWFIKAHATRGQVIMFFSIFLLNHILFYSAFFVVTRKWNKLRKLWHGFRDGIQSSPA